MKLSKLKKNVNNPRIIKGYDFEKLCQSIRNFPQMLALRPITYDENFMILGGSQRFEAVKRVFGKEAPDDYFQQVTDLTESQKEEFIIKDNTNFGSWNWNLLGNEWDNLPLADWGVDAPVVFAPLSPIEPSNEPEDGSPLFFFDPQGFTDYYLPVFES